MADQTYENIEFVIVDDNSPTPAREAVSDVELTGIRTKFIRHDENRGANEARNTGIRNAEGSYVAFLDDDDEWKPPKIEKQVKAFTEGRPDIGVVYTGSEFIYDDYTRTVIYTNRGDVTRDILMGDSFGKFSSLMVSSEAIESAGLPDTEFPSWQDWEWLLRLSECCLFETVTEPLTIRRCLPDNERISDNFEEKRDVSYPRFLKKHRDLAASYGSKYERGFIASLSDKLGRAALQNGYYADARRYLLKSCYYYPFDKKRLIYTLVSLGGSYSYEPVSRLVRTIHGMSNQTTMR